MTDQTPTPQQPNPARKSWFVRHKILTGLGAFVLLIVIISAANSGGSGTSTETASSDTASTSDTSGSTSTDEVTDDTTAVADQQPDMTVAQENALEAAKNYISMTPFSRKGLIDQLSSKAGDGYARADAKFAVNHLHVNWKKQAVRAGKNYLDMTSFSRDGLIQQLSSRAGDQYTHAQAVYAANHLGF